MVFHHWQHNIRMYRFSDKTYFANGISQLRLLNTYSLLFLQAFLLVIFIIMQLQLINLIITHQLHHYLSYFIFFSFESWIIWQIPSPFKVSNYFLSVFGCYECWLPRIRLSLHYERHWWLLHKIHKGIELKKGNTGIA